MLNLEEIPAVPSWDFTTIFVWWPNYFHSECRWTSVCGCLNSSRQIFTVHTLRTLKRFRTGTSMTMITTTIGMSPRYRIFFGSSYCNLQVQSTYLCHFRLRMPWLISWKSSPMMVACHTIGRRFPSIIVKGRTRGQFQSKQLQEHKLWISLYVHCGKSARWNSRWCASCATHWISLCRTPRDHWIIA